jgi:hypothetical protein
MVTTVKGETLGRAARDRGVIYPGGQQNVGLDTGITTDTGDLAPIPPVYTRFPEPLACIAAAQWIRKSIDEGTLNAQARRDSRLSLIRPEDDTLPTAARVTAQKCGSRFTLATTTHEQWPDLFLLRLMEGRDTAAYGMLDQLLAMVKPATRAQLLSWAIEQYLAAKPARLEAAEAATARLDTMVGDNTMWQLQRGAHDALFKFALLYSSWPLIDRYGTAWIAFERANVATLGAGTLLDVYRQLLEGAFIEAPDSVSAVAKRLRADFSAPAVQQVLTAVSRNGGEALDPKVCQLNLTSATPIAQIVSELLPTYMSTTSAAPPLHADFWFPPPGSSPGDTVRPTSGRISLIYRWVGTHSGGSGGCEGTINNCRDQTNVLKGLLDRYGTRLSGTVVVDASGFTMFHVPASPAEVARSYQWYFQQFLKLPVAVAVRMRPVREQRPLPDGRIFYRDATAYHDVYSQNLFVVTGRRNELVYELPVLAESAVSRLNHVIAHEEAQ